MTSRTLLEPASGFGRRGELVPSRRQPIVTVTPIGVRARLRRVRHRFGSRFATYALHVDNTLTTAVESSTYAFEPARPDLPVVPTHHAFAAETSSAAVLRIALPGRRPYRCVTEIRAGASTLVFEETLPLRRAGFVLPLFALVIATLLVFGLAFARPGVATLRAPSRVPMGVPFAVGYDFARARGGAYTVVAADGMQVASGQLLTSDGAFSLALPTTAHAQSYMVRVAARNAFGEDARTIDVGADAGTAARAPVHAAGPRRIAHTITRAPALRIAELSIAHDTVAGGKPIAMTYDVPTTEGSLRLIDESGTVRAEALLTRRGDSMLIAPLVDEDQDFRVVLHASRHDQQAEASLPIRITKAFSLDEFLAAARVAKKGPVAVVDANVPAGDPVRVAIVQREPEMHLSLSDAQGREVGSADVAPDQTLVTFPSSGVTSPQHYTLSTTYRKGVSEETLLTPLVVGAPPRANAPPASTSSTPQPQADAMHGTAISP